MRTGWNSRVLAAMAVFVLFVSVAARGATPVAARTDGQASTLSVGISSAPGGRGPLSRRHVNVVPVPPNLSFKVVVRNGAPQRRVKITLSIIGRPSSYAPIVKTRSITLALNQMAAVEFGNLGRIAFAQRETLKLAVADSQAHEVWVATYPVIFSLP
ncbi:MAG: hypothetical protein QOF57_825 [Frankiaceae bacterium]|nr:hypothetical protein [Frankiaceae bacterium]